MESQRTVKFFRIRLSDKANPGDARLQAPVDQGCNNLRAYPALPVLRQDYEVLDITIRYTIGNDSAHTDSPAGFCIDRDSKGKTALYEITEIFGFIFVFPPSPGLIECSYLFSVPRTDNHHCDIFCHKKPCLYYCLNDSMIPMQRYIPVRTVPGVRYAAEWPVVMGFPEV